MFKITKKSILLLTIIVIFISFFSNIEAVTSADYQKKIEELKKQQQQTTTQITSVEEKVEKYNKEVETLDSEIDNYSKTLDQLQTKLDEINEKIKTYESNLQNSAQQYNSAKELYETRLRAIYENGIPNVMDLLVTSNGIADFFSRMNVYSSVIEYDQSLIGNIQNEKEYTDNIKKEIENEKLQIDQITYDKEKTAGLLESAKAVKEATVEVLNSDKANLEKKNALLKQQEIAAKKQMEEEIAKELQARIEAERKKGGVTYTGNFNGAFTWPTPGVYQVNAMYKDKEYLAEVGIPHYGMDVGARTGNSVVAAADGVVEFSRYNKGGYGYYIMINHGKISSDGSVYRTIYGHNSSLLVSEGQKVVKGQRIALSGNTGFSSGAHLHFEVRRYSSATTTSYSTVDPMNYFISSGAPFTYLSNGRIISFPYGNLKQYQN